MYKSQQSTNSSLFIQPFFSCNMASGSFPRKGVCYNPIILSYHDSQLVTLPSSFFSCVFIKLLLLDHCSFSFLHKFLTDFHQISHFNLVFLLRFFVFCVSYTSVFSFLHSSKYSVFTMPLRQAIVNQNQHGNQESALFVQPSESPNSVLVTPPLNGLNYLAWSSM